MGGGCRRLVRLPCTRRMHQTPRGRGPSRDIFGPGVCGACCGRRASVASSTRSSLVSIGETRRDTVNRTCRAPRAMRPAPRPRRPASRADVCQLPWHTAHDSSVGRGAAGVAAAGARACPGAGVRLYRVWVGDTIRRARRPRLDSRLLRLRGGGCLSAISGRRVSLRRAMCATEPNAQ